MCSNAATSFVEILSCRQERVFFTAISPSFYHKTTPTGKLLTQNLVEKWGSLQPRLNLAPQNLTTGGSIFLFKSHQLANRFPAFALDLFGFENPL
jgi:hypothetical protein